MQQTKTTFTTFFETVSMSFVICILCSTLKNNSNLKTFTTSDRLLFQLIIAIMSFVLPENKITSIVNKGFLFSWNDV